MIVVDSNVLAYFYLPGEYTAAAEALFEHDPDWVAPVLWRSEFQSILAGHRIRTLCELSIVHHIRVLRFQPSSGS